MLQLSRPSDLLILERHDDDMEVFVELDDLVEVLLLHLGASPAHLAFVFGEEDLVDDDIMDIDVELSKLLDEAFCLIHRQELRNADSNEGSLG